MGDVMVQLGRQARQRATARPADHDLAQQVAEQPVCYNPGPDAEQVRWIKITGRCQ